MKHPPTVEASQSFRFEWLASAFGLFSQGASLGGLSGHISREVFVCFSRGSQELVEGSLRELRKVPFGSSGFTSRPSL